MSHNDTIELCGLPGDERDSKRTDKGKEKVSNGSEHGNEVIDESVLQNPMTYDDMIDLDDSLDIADEFATEILVKFKTSKKPLQLQCFIDYHVIPCESCRHIPSSHLDTRPSLRLMFLEFLSRRTKLPGSWINLKMERMNSK